jgi:hypothetical protein
LHAGTHVGGWTTREIHEAILTTFHLSADNYSLNQLRYDLRKLKGHGLLERDGTRYAYLLTRKGVQVALLLLFFHKRLCGPLANSRFTTGQTRNIGQTAASNSRTTAPTEPSKRSPIFWRQPDPSAHLSASQTTHFQRNPTTSPHAAAPSLLPENQPIPLPHTAASISILTSHATAFVGLVLSRILRTRI